jgi:hypothetical protein
VTSLCVTLRHSKRDECDDPLSKRMASHLLTEGVVYSLPSVRLSVSMSRSQAEHVPATHARLVQTIGDNSGTAHSKSQQHSDLERCNG